MGATHEVKTGDINLARLNINIEVNRAMQVYNKTINDSKNDMARGKAAADKMYQEAISSAGKLKRTQLKESDADANTIRDNNETLQDNASGVQQAEIVRLESKQADIATKAIDKLDAAFDDIITRHRRQMPSNNGKVVV
jgi:hypothetical protein